MKYLLVDDEVLARTKLKEIIKSIEPKAKILEAETGEQAIEQFEKHLPPIALIDIRMPGISGIELAYHLSSVRKSPAIIFTTAHDEYALEAFDANAIDYILKPVQAERLNRALHKAYPLTKQQSMALKDEEARSHISVNQKGRLKLLSLKNILYFKAENKYVCIRTADAQYLINDTLNQLEEDFGNQFLRVHRNALISTQHIDGLEKNPDGKWIVLFKDIDDTLEISRRQTPLVRRWLRNKPMR